MNKLTEARRLLVVRLGSMGDVIHALPAVHQLKRALPHAAIDWAVEPAWMPLLERNPDISEILPLSLKRWRRELFRPRTWGELRGALRKLRLARYDCAIDLQGLIKSAVLARWSGAKTVAGFETRQLRESAAAHFLNIQIPTNRRHVVDCNLALIHGLFACPSPAAPKFWLPQGRESPALPAGPYLLASPVAGWRSKQWPAERYAELAALAWRQLALPLVLDCASQGEAYCAAIRACAPAGACILHVSSLAELIGATRRASAVIGVDSGPLHLAAALGKPGVALFGPTSPERNGPYGSTLAVLRQAGAPTSYKRKNYYTNAMKSLSVERVWGAVCEKLDISPRRLEVVAGSMRP